MPKFKLTKEEMNIITSAYRSMLPIKAKYVEAWQLVSKYIDPAYGEMTTDKRPETVVIPSNKDIYNTFVYQCSYIGAAGLKSYTCSSQSNFFSLEFEKELNDKETKTKIGDLQTRTLEMFKMLRRSSFYKTTHSFFKSYLDLSTAIMVMGESDDKEKFYYEYVPVSQCTTIKNMRSKEVEVLYRSQWLTYYDAASKYGAENLPQKMREAGKKDPMVTYEFIQMFAKRERFKINYSNNFRWVEIVWAKDDESKAIFIGGDDYKPFIVTTFNSSSDISGFGIGSPGFRQCFNSMGLQSMTKDQIIGSEYAAKKPIMKTEGITVNIRPAGFIDVPPGGSITPLDLGSDMSWTLNLINKFESQAKADYFVDFFLMLSQYQGNVNTATLAQGLQNEQVKMLTGFLDNLGSEFFEPLIEWTWGKMNQRGLFGKDSLENLSFNELKIDYISPLYLLQKQAAMLQPTLSCMQMFLPYLELDPSLGAYINFEGFVQVAREATNADVRLINDSETAKKILEAQRQVQSYQQALDNQIKEQDSNSKAYVASTKAPEEGSVAQQKNNKKLSLRGGSNG